MNLALRGLAVQAGAFSLELDLEIGAAATAVFGPSGAGKTILLETIAGLRVPRRGSITLGGRTLCDAATRGFVPARDRRIGYVPQDMALFPHLDVRQNLLYGFRDKDGTGVTLGHVAEVLEIAPLLDRGVANLSGGEARRVAVARALLSSPQLLLLDEPLAGLDRALRGRVLPYLRQVRDEFRVPLLYVTHEADEVRELCDEVVLLDAGRVEAHGAPEAVLTAPRRTRTLRPRES